MKRPVLTLAVTVAWSTLVAFCAAPPSDCVDPTLLEHESLTGDPHALRYTLNWNLSRIIRGEGDGWTTTTDLGYEVRVSQGYVVTLRSELVPCDETNALDTCATLWRFLTQPGRAHAGHGDDEPDPSRWAIGQVESLTDLEALTADSLTLDGPAYCQSHYLVHPAFGFTLGLPDDVDMIGRSLYIAGEFRRPGSSSWEPLEAHTSYSNGALMALQGDGSLGSTFAHPGLEDVRVIITRELASLFDGINIEAVDAEELGDAILWNLVDHTISTVQTGPEQ